MKSLRMEVKVCEGCGGLWVRRQSDSNPYCRVCGPRLKEFYRSPRSMRQTRVRRAVHSPGHVKTLEIRQAEVALCR